MQVSEDLKGLLVPIDALTLDPRNARIHKEHNLQAITSSLQRFGQVRPVVIDNDNVVIAGNGVVMAAQALEWTHVAAVIADLTPGSPEQLAYAIADNRIAELSGWDESRLVEQLKALARDDLLEGSGFVDADIAALEVRLADESARAEMLRAARAEGPEVPALSFTVVFDTMRQKSLFDAFLRALQPSYPDLATSGDRIIQCLLDKREIV